MVAKGDYRLDGDSGSEKSGCHGVLENGRGVATGGRPGGDHENKGVAVAATVERAGVAVTRRARSDRRMMACAVVLGFRSARP